MEKIMTITNLVKYFKEIKYKHKKNNNINLEIKYKIYQSYSEKSKTMSKNRFCSYLKAFWITISRTKKIIQIGEENKPNSLTFSFWENYQKENYKKRYIWTSRTKKVAQLTEKQIKYLIKLREEEPNKGYKLFENGLFIPENKKKHEKIFPNYTVSKRLFYDVIKENNLPHRITKTKKIWLLAQHKKDNTLETYLAKQHHVYVWYKAFHKWQVDIKYLTDIPNYVQLWLFDIYLYEITFRDYKTWLTICYFGDDKSKTSVLLAFEMFEKLMLNIWLNLKNIEFQFDWGAEFSNIRINDVKGALIEMIEEKYKGFKLINRKEQNGHVETFHRRIEEDLFDTKAISNLKEQVDKWKITKKELKKEILRLLNTYILNFNKYWYSSYKPRYELFNKKSPLEIAKKDWKEEIENNKINIEFVEKYFGAYDVSRAYTMTKIVDYPYVLNSYMLLKENKFDLAKKSYIIISDNYLVEFKNFLSNNLDIQSGLIWNGTIQFYSTYFM